MGGMFKSPSISYTPPPVIPVIDQKAPETAQDTKIDLTPTSEADQFKANLKKRNVMAKNITTIKSSTPAGGQGTA